MRVLRTQYRYYKTSQPESQEAMDSFETGYAARILLHIFLQV